jgi:hypothetical protein
VVIAKSWPSSPIVLKSESMMTFGAFAKGPEFEFPLPPQAVKNTEATRTNAGLEFIAFPIRD